MVVDHFVGYFPCDGPDAEGCEWSSGFAFCCCHRLVPLLWVEEFVVWNVAADLGVLFFPAEIADIDYLLVVYVFESFFEAAVADPDSDFQFSINFQ